MKHADRPRAHTTGESQLRFATREMLLTGFCITYHGESRESTTAWWEEALWKGRAWRVCRVLPELHHAPWAKHMGTGRENRDPACVAGRGWSGPREVTDFFNRGKMRGRMGETWEADVAGQEGQNRLLGSSVVRRPNARRAVEGTWIRLVALPGSGRGRCVLAPGPRRVHLKPKVHSSRLFEYSWKELSLVIFIKSLSP